MNVTYKLIGEGDQLAFLEISNCPEVQKLSIFQHFKEQHKSAVDVFNTLVALNKKDSYLSYIIFQDNQPVGSLCRVRKDKGSKALVIGGWIDKNHRGKGLFEKSLAVLLGNLQKEDPCYTFNATVREDNIPSLKTLKKIGFREIDRTKDNPPKINFVYP